MLLKELLEVLNTNTQIKIDTPTKWVVDEPTYVKDTKRDVSNYLEHKVINVELRRKDYYDFYLYIEIEEYSAEQKETLWWNS